MKSFSPRTKEDLIAMYATVAAGELVLHHVPGHVPDTGSPACFRFSTSGTAWLFHTNRETLRSAAAKLGVKRIIIDRKCRKLNPLKPDTITYYVTYLCGKPLEKALAKNQPQRRTISVRATTA